MKAPGGLQHLAEARQRAALERLRGLAHQPGEKASRKKTEERIDVIFAMMRDGTWKTGKSSRELAEVWNLSAQRVEQLASEASRLFRRMVNERFEDRESVLLEIQHTLHRLVTKAEQLGTSNALDVAGRNAERLAKYLGLEPVQRHEIVQNKFSAWTDAELKEYVRTGKRPEPSPSRPKGNGIKPSDPAE